MFHSRENILGMYTKTAISNHTDSSGLMFAVSTGDGEGPSTTSTLVRDDKEYAAVVRRLRKGRPGVQVHPVRTPVLDVCEFLQKHVRAETSDHVVVKVDVEGVDEIVLERIASGCHELVDTVAYEYAAVMPITPRFRSLGVTVRPWA